MVFTIMVINVLKDLVGKVNNIHEQMKNFSGVMDSVRKNQMKC